MTNGTTDRITGTKREKRYKTLKNLRFKIKFKIAPSQIMNNRIKKYAGILELKYPENFDIASNMPIGNNNIIDQVARERPKKDLSRFAFRAKLYTKSPVNSANAGKTGKI